MNFPCPNKISCPPQGNLDYDFPIANLTSELPDHEIFVGMAWGPLDAGGSQPPLGSVWRARGCAFVCTSIISQADADLCAQQQAALCTWDQWDPGHPPPGPGGSGGTPQPTVYTNALAQCPAGCPDGSTFTWTILPGTYFALSQALADEIALSVACQKALHFFFCIGSLTSTAQTGQSYFSTAAITGNNRGPFTAQIIAGALPDGLFMSQGTRSIIVSGTPSKAGTFNFTIQVSDAAGNFMQKAFTITVQSSCVDLWTSLAGLWSFSTAGTSSAGLVGNTIQLFADAPKPGPSFGLAQASVVALVPTTQDLDCSFTVIPVNVFNLPPAAFVQFSLSVTDATTAAVYLNLNFDGSTLPLATSFPFHLPSGAKIQVSLICQLVNNLNGQDSILAYNIQLG